MHNSFFSPACPLLSRTKQTNKKKTVLGVNTMLTNSNASLPIFGLLRREGCVVVQLRARHTDHRTSHPSHMRRQTYNAADIFSMCRKKQTEGHRVLQRHETEERRDVSLVGSQLDRSRPASLMRTPTPRGFRKIQFGSQRESALGETHQQGGAALCQINSAII